MRYAEGDARFGPESRGLRLRFSGVCDQQRIRVPMVSGSRSLNLSNSVAVVLYEHGGKRILGRVCRTQKQQARNLTQCADAERGFIHSPCIEAGLLTQRIQKFPVFRKVQTLFVDPEDPRLPSSSHVLR